MLRRIAILTLLGLTLSSCSYAYDLLAVVRDGRLMFVVDPASGRQPSCLRRIQVTAEDDQRDTFWLTSVTYDDDCANKFPLPYGATLVGQHQQDSEHVKAKPLGRGTIYEVSATTGATGYGGGRFIIHTGGRVENLKFQDSSPENNETATSLSVSFQPSDAVSRRIGYHHIRTFFGSAT